MRQDLLPYPAFPGTFPGMDFNEPIFILVKLLIINSHFTQEIQKYYQYLYHQ